MIDGSVSVNPVLNTSITRLIGALLVVVMHAALLDTLHAAEVDVVIHEKLKDLNVIGDPQLYTADYLIDSSPFVAKVGRSTSGNEIILDNGLIRRVWRLAPNGACIRFDNLMTGQSMLRSVRPEARVTVDGVQKDVGGLVGQPNHAFLTEAWIDQMVEDPDAMRLVDFAVGVPEERVSWARRRHAAPDAVWPPKGVSLQMTYEPVSTNRDAPGPEYRVNVQYEIYDGVPVMSKRITLVNIGAAPITVNRFVSEELAGVEQSSWIERRDGVALPTPDYLHVETSFAFGGMTAANANRHVVHWRTDPLYTSQVNWLKQTPCLLVCEPERGPAQRVEPGGVFDGFHVFELVYASSDREHQGMAYRRMYRTIAPWATENPITHHLLTNDPEKAIEAIDRAAEVGFEAIIFSFGSGFDMENRDPKHLAIWKRVAAYASEKGIELGSYSLLSSRNVEPESMAVMPAGVHATHGRLPSLTSEWGQNWLRTIRAFYRDTGFSQFENDGPYPGDIDTTPRPPLQQGIEDSRWVQWKLNRELYQALLADGVYINQPDYNFLNGGAKTSMGYREVNWSLPRAQQLIHTRQNIYDGTWMKTPSMGWMHVPLAEYHGGGPDATVEPLHEHLSHYRMMLLSNLGMGVQAHYRGPRIYDTEETRDMVKQVVRWFKTYRDILESDIVHGRRCDARQLDWVLHANPTLDTKGMLCVYNPLARDVTEVIRVNLYYTGITGATSVGLHDAHHQEHALGGDHTIALTVTVPAHGMTWYTIRPE